MRVLVLGGTGAMGIHVCQLLAEFGHDVVVTSRREHSSHYPNLAYVKGNAKDLTFLRQLLREHWGGIIDFMIWSTSDFDKCYEALLAATDQYIYMSSYRVYADSPLITEDSPRLLDVSDDPEYLATDEYALAKARCENLLFKSVGKNWTVVRPAITYDGSGRFQLGVYEVETWLWRASHGIAVPFPEKMLDKQATMTWGGDVARMVVLLVGNSAAMGEVFTVSTSEHHTWAEIAGFYREVISLDIVPCDLAEFERVWRGVYQIRYDRMFDRVVDNSKILAATGLTQVKLASLEDGLRHELRQYLEIRDSKASSIGLQGKLDRLLGESSSLKYLAADGLVTLIKYVGRRFF